MFYLFILHVWFPLCQLTWNSILCSLIVCIFRCMFYTCFKAFLHANFDTLFSLTSSSETDTINKTMFKLFVIIIIMLLIHFPYTCSRSFKLGVVKPNWKEVSKVQSHFLCETYITSISIILTLSVFNFCLFV